MAAALAYYLSSGESVNEAMLHARSYVSMKPKGYTEDNSRSGELYNLFLSAIDRFYNRYSDVAFYAEQLGVSARYLGQVTRSIAHRSPKAMIDERCSPPPTNPSRRSPACWVSPHKPICRAITRSRRGSPPARSESKGHVHTRGFTQNDDSFTITRTRFPVVQENPLLCTQILINSKN